MPNLIFALDLDYSPGFGPKTERHLAGVRSTSVPSLVTPVRLAVGLSTG